MAKRLPPRNSKGRFVKRSSAPRRKRRTARVHTGAFGRKTRRVRVVKHPVLVNKRRRKYAYVSNRRRRRAYGKNPRLGGIFARATLKNVGFAVIGLAGTPMLTGFINRYLPTTLTANKWAGYAIKGASAYGISLLAGRVAGRDAQKAALVGGLAYVTLGIISDFFPTLLPSTTGTGRYLSAQPLLAGAREYPFLGTSGPITAGAPSRLDPAGRF